jgi:hypothetical protein
MKTALLSSRTAARSRSIDGLGELLTDLVRPRRDVDEQLEDLHPPLGDEERVEGVPHAGQHVEPRADEVVFRALHLAQGRLLRQAQLAGGHDVLRDVPVPLAVGAGGLGRRPGQHGVGVEPGLDGLAPGGLDGRAGALQARVVLLRVGHELRERARRRPREGLGAPRRVGEGQFLGRRLETQAVDAGRFGGREAGFPGRVPRGHAEGDEHHRHEDRAPPTRPGASGGGDGLVAREWVHGFGR